MERFFLTLSGIMRRSTLLVSVLLLIISRSEGRDGTTAPMEYLRHDGTDQRHRDLQKPPDCGGSGARECHRECGNQCSADGSAFNQSCCEACGQFAPPNVCGTVSTPVPTSTPSLTPSESSKPSPKPVEPTGTCSTASSVPCSSDTDCATKRCIGGQQNGSSCTDNSDCPNANAGICQGGTRNTMICTTDNNDATTGCPDTLGTCSGSVNVGDPCTSADDCPSDQSQGTCVGGKDDGQTGCFTDNDCADKGPNNLGTCQGTILVGTCNGYVSASCLVTNTGTCSDITDDVCVSTLPPVKVFILTGQSNMLGQGRVDESTNGYPPLDALIADKTLSPLHASHGFTFSKLGPGTSNSAPYAQRDDVIIHHFRADNTPVVGKLSAGYGANSNKLGPELGIGWVLGDADPNPIFLIKISWGGKSLSTDFRPPNASCTDQHGCSSTDPTHAWDENLQCCNFGYYYNLIVSRAMSSLSDINAGAFDNQIPFFSTRGYDIAGMIYFQGFNDVINRDRINEHEGLLKLFMSDIRSQENGLNVPNMPFVIGELGMHGLEIHWDGVFSQDQRGRISDLKTAQKNAADSDSDARLAKTDLYMYEPVGHYHYHDRADTFYAMGESMGEQMKEMVYPQLFE